MARNMLGIDIGTSTVRIADVRDSQIIQYVEVPLPYNAVKDGRVISFNALADVIRTALKENRIHCRRAALSISTTNNIVVRRVTMPKMTEAQLMINMPYELHDFLNSDIKDYLFDYSLVSMGEKDMTIMACAIGKKTVENFRTMAKLAGLQIEKIVPDVIALEAILPEPEETEGDQAEDTSDAQADSADMADAAAQETPDDSDEVIAMTPREVRKAKREAQREAKLAAAKAAKEQKAAEKLARQKRQNQAAGSRNDSEAPAARDFVILDVGHGGTRLYFYSNYTFEITRNIDVGANQIAEIIAKNRGMDKHAAWTRLSAADPDILSDQEVDDEIGSFVAQVMRSINFYGYNNLNNTIDRIYYMGSGLPPKCYLQRLEEATNMKCEPAARLLPQSASVKGINDGPQVYGCVVE